MEQDPLQRLKAMLEDLIRDGVGHSEDPVDHARMGRYRGFIEMIGDRRLLDLIRTALREAKNLNAKDLEEKLHQFEKEHDIDILDQLTKIENQLDRLIEEEKSRPNPAFDLLSEIYAARRDESSRDGE